jgi:hypothetical protein
MGLANRRTAIIDWIKLGTNLDSNHVIWLDQDMPRPSLPYVGVRMTTLKTINREAIYAPNEDGEANIVTHKEFTLNLHYYGNSSNDPIEKLMILEDSQFKEGSKSVLEAQQLVIVQTLMGPSDTAVKLDTVYESRGSMDLLMRMPWELTDSDQGNIEEIILKETLNNVADELITEDEITIP